jgi:DNA mismatch endonuclease (patch repair protein)
MAGRRDPAITSRMMARVRAKNTRPEIALRKELFRRGLRYRIHMSNLPGRPDICFPRVRVAVFVDGDFWHGKGWEERRLASFEEQFPTNRRFWVNKINRNMERDGEVNRELQAHGWRVLRVLESQLRADLEAQADRIERETRAPMAAH